MALARCAADETESVLGRVRSWAHEGIGVRPVWRPLHTLPIYRGALYHGEGRAEAVYPVTFCLPSSVGLTKEEIDRVVEVLHR